MHNSEAMIKNIHFAVNYLVQAFTQYSSIISTLVSVVKSTVMQFLQNDQYRKIEVLVA